MAETEAKDLGKPPVCQSIQDVSNPVAGEPR
jgi:hypothetical protein